MVGRGDMAGIGRGAPGRSAAAIPAGLEDPSEAYLQEMAFIAVLASAMTVSMGSVV